MFSLTLTNNSYCSSVPIIPQNQNARDTRRKGQSCSWSIIWLAMSGSKRVLGDFICNKGRIHEEKRQRQPNNFDEEYRTIKAGRIVAAKGIEEMQSRVPLCIGPHRFKKGKLYRIRVARLAFKKDLKRNEREVKVPC